MKETQQRAHQLPTSLVFKGLGSKEGGRRIEESFFGQVGMKCMNLK